MKIIPERFTPQYIEFSAEEMRVLRAFVARRYGYNPDSNERNIAYESVVGTLRTNNRFPMTKEAGHYLQREWHDQDYDRFYIKSEGGGPVYLLSEFEEYCRKTGFVNGKQYRIT